jgi:hypothetical protein
VRGPDSGWLDPILRGTIGIAAVEGGILGQGVALASLSVSLPHLRLLFHCKTLYQNLNSICNISIFRALNLWFVCVYL